jgi:hypothetical protein
MIMEWEIPDRILKTKLETPGSTLLAGMPGRVRSGF